MNTWIKISTDVVDHPKLIGLPLDAFGLWVKILAYSGRHLTDGRIKKEVICHFTRSKVLVNSLLAHDLLTVEGDEYVIVNWEKYQKSREQVYREKQGMRERKARQRSRESHSEVTAKSQRDIIKSHGVTLFSDTDTDTDTDIPPINPPKGDGVVKRRSYPAEFERFWAVFPVKQGKPKALEAWQKACKRATLEEILSGAGRYAQWAQHNPDRPLKWAQGWLNDDRWMDDYSSGVNVPQNQTSSILDWAKTAQDPSIINLQAIRAF